MPDRRSSVSQTSGGRDGEREKCTRNGKRKGGMEGEVQGG